MHGHKFVFFFNATSIHEYYCPKGCKFASASDFQSRGKDVSWHRLGFYVLLFACWLLRLLLLQFW